MDYLYGQLPEMVYDPVDFTGVSGNGTVHLRIDSNKRIIEANVLRVPGTLQIVDLNSGTTTTYNGSKDTVIEIPKFEDSLKVEYGVATQADLNANIFPAESNMSVGDGYLKLTLASGEEVYAPIPSPVAAGNGVQQLKSLEVFSSSTALPGSAAVGDCYVAHTSTGAAVFQRTETTMANGSKVYSWEPISEVTTECTYVDLNTGLLATGVIDVQKRKLTSLSTANDRKQDKLYFDGLYNPENNKVATQASIESAVAALNSKIISSENTQAAKVAELDSRVDTRIGNLQISITNEINSLNTRLSTVETKTATVENKMTTLEYKVEESVGGYQKDFTAVSDDVKTLREEVAASYSTIDAVKDDMSDFKSDIIGITNDLKKGATVKDIKHIGTNEETGKEIFEQVFQDGSTIRYEAAAGPKGDTGESTHWYIEAISPSMTIGYNTGDCWLNSQTGEVFYLVEDEDGIASWQPKGTVKGEKGDKGDSGNDGKDGTNGKDGADGATPHIGENGHWFIGTEDSGVVAGGQNGQSAYELAKSLGFDGDEQSWLESLKGATGETGKAGEKGEQGEPGAPLKVEKFYSSITEMQEHLAEIADRTFVIAKDGEVSKLFYRQDSNLKEITNFNSIIVPDGLVVENQLLKLASGGIAISDGIKLPATGAKGLDFDSTEDGNVKIWLIDDDGDQLGDAIEVAATGGGGTGVGTTYSYRIVNLLDATSFNVTNAEDNVVLKFACQEKDAGQIFSGTASTVKIEYSHDGNNYTTIADGIQVLNDAPYTFNYPVSNCRIDYNYFRITATAGTAVDNNDKKLVKSMTYTVKVLECRIVTDLNPFATWTSNITVQYSCIGADLDKHVHLFVYDEDGEVYHAEKHYGKGSHNTGKYTSFNIDTTNFEHKVYKLDMYFTYTDNMNIERESAHVIQDLMFSTGVHSPLLSATFNKTKVTYGDIEYIPWAAYTPDNADKTNLVELSIFKLVNGERERIYFTQYENINNNEVPNDGQGWAINFGSVGFPAEGTLVLRIDTVQGAHKEFTVQVLPLAGLENVLLHSDGMIAYIAPTGQMNSVINADSLDVDFTDRNNNKTVIQSEMIDFNYTSNGFLLEEGTGTPFVRLSGDARLRIHLPLFTNNYYDSEGTYISLLQKATSGRTAEFRFKVSHTTKQDTTVINFFTKDESLSTDDKLVGSGFYVQPKMALFTDTIHPVEFDDDNNIKQPDAVAVTHFCEDEVIRLSFVLESHNDSDKQALKIYTNGELTRIIPYAQTTEISGPAYIELGSNDCIFDLYSAVFYEKALADADILTNYLADIPSIPQRIKEYDHNDVLSSSGSRGTQYINFDSMLDYQECIKRIPCILTTGQMSRVKGDKTKVGMIITKPGENGEVLTVFSNAAGEQPCQTNVQGTTSSQLYPRYNYKLTPTNGAGNKVPLYLLRNEEGNIELLNSTEIAARGFEGAIGEKTFCWKADMMSPDHANTVNAVWFDEFYTDKTPPQEENSFVHPTVWGFRCLLFNRLSEDDTITFMGDGCLNNDKGNADTFGLTADCDTDSEDAYWTSNNTTVTDYEFTDKGETEVVAVVDNYGDVQTKSQKWEFLDNSPEICNFFDSLFFKRNLVYNDKTQEYEDKGYKVDAALESTFPDQGDLEDWGLTPNYSHVQLLFLWVLKRANFWKDENGNEVSSNFCYDYEGNIIAKKVYNGVEYTNERAYRKAIFENEFTKHFNLDHTLAYYIACNITGLMDNWAKNMFLSCYDTQADKIKFNTTKYPTITSLHTMINYAQEHNGNIPEDAILWDESEFAIWYPTLYDLDSCYGVDNKGYKWVPYYADWDYMKWGQDESEEGSMRIMNGSNSYFWRMFYEVYYNNGTIKSKYQALCEKEATIYDDKSKPLPSSVLSLSYWKDRMIRNNIDTVPVRITTEDSIFKYAMPWYYGYQKELDKSNTENGMKTWAATDDFLYLIQANKRLQDTDFMTQRFNLYNSEFDAPDFLNDYIQVTQMNPTTSDISLTLTPAQRMWCKVQYGTNSDAAIIDAGEITLEGEAVTITAPYSQSGYKEDGVHIYGASLLSEVQGLEKLRGNTFNFSSAVRLRKLILGSDTDNENTAAPDVSNCQLLEELNIRNCKKITDMQLGNNGLLKKVDAKGAGLTTITFPNGGYLEEVYLPNSLQQLQLRKQENINTFQLGTWDNKGNYTMDVSSLQTIFVEGQMPRVPLAEILESSLGNASFKGLRLEDVYLDISGWTDINRVKAFVSLLASDSLEGKQLDAEGKPVEYDVNNSATRFPVVSGWLKLPNELINNSSETEVEILDELITQIAARYSTLFIVPPENRKLFKNCRWYEVAAVCAAASAGILTDNGVPCDIKRELVDILEDGTEVYSGWWTEGDGRSVKMKDGSTIVFSIAGFWQAETPYGEKLPLSLITDTAFPVPTDTVVSDDPSSRFWDELPRYMCEVEIDGTKYTPDAAFGQLEVKNGDSVRDIEITFTKRSYIDYIAVTVTNYKWYFNNAKTNGLPMSTMHFSQARALGVSDDTREVEDLKFTSRVDWKPAGDADRIITIDATAGDVHIFNRQPDATGNFVRAIEFKPGSKIILHNVDAGATVQISCMNDISAGNSGLMAYVGMEGYWKSSIATYVQSDNVWGKFPTALQNCAKTTRVWANIGSLSSEVEYRDVKIYLPSMYDLGFGTQGIVQAYANETAPDNPLSYFADTNPDDNIGTQNALIGSAGQRKCGWWTRSASYYRFGHAQAITSGGTSEPVDLRWTKNYIISRVNI